MTLNTKITRYFIENSRVTAMALLMLVVLGVVSILSLRTTGFPSPKINFAVVNALYPGASANTVVEQLTKPLENSIKAVEGVKSVSSTSRDSFAIVSVSIDEKANVESVKAKIDSAVRSVKLPDGAERPEVVTPNISGQDYYFAVARKDMQFNPKETFDVISTLKEEITKDSDVTKFDLGTNVNKKIAIQVNNEKMSSYGLTYDDVITQLKTWGASLPVTNGAELDGKVYSIVLSVDGNSVEDIKNIKLMHTPANVPSASMFTGGQVMAPQIVKLGDIADVHEKYYLEDDSNSIVGYAKNGVNTVTPAALFSLDINDSADLAKYDPKLTKITDKYFNADDAEHKKLPDVTKQLFDKYELIKVYSVADSNKEQVGEVISGLIGEKWHLNNIPMVGYLGFLFGGIELVFLLMLILVSWRAALIAALALPLSFFFSTLWVLLTGNDLNTLVLFSLVLVIGLVVDPALVVLESIQRNLDNGLPAKDAVLKAVEEIGNGLFLAVLTSILVFAPFGVVSGIFGQIISYIPLTIIPALIGSFIVPLVFLSWFGGKLLKRKPNKTNDEEKNLWGAARAMIRINTSILHWHPFFRLLLIALAIVVPFLIAGSYLGTGKVKSVQFAQPDDTEFLAASTVNFPQKSNEQLKRDNAAFVNEVMFNGNIESISSVDMGEGNGNKYNTSYFIRLKPKADRTEPASKIKTDLNNDLQKRFKDTFFSTNVVVNGAGPSAASFPVAIAVKTNDLDEQRVVAKKLTEILGQVCKKTDTEVELNASCRDGDKLIVKVDNGYDGREVKFIEVKLSRDKIATNPVNPIDLKTVISNLFAVNDGNRVAVLKSGNSDVDVVIEKTQQNPQKLDEVKNTEVRTLTGQLVKLSDIAEIKEVDSVQSISRVKGETVGTVLAKTTEGNDDSAKVAQIQKLVIDEYDKTVKDKHPNVVVETYSEGDTASIAKSLSELFIALILAIVLTYIVLVVFFNSFSAPLVILFAIPLTFIGIFPALAYFGGGQLGFLEIIGIIILVGLVENVAIFLIDAANQKIKEGWDPKAAIAYASGVRFRPIILTKLTTLVSTAPLAILSEFYRSLSVVIIFGLLTSGLLSLITSPILFIYFRYVSKHFRSYPLLGKILFLLFLPVGLILMPIFDSFRLVKVDHIESEEFPANPAI